MEIKVTQLAMKHMVNLKLGSKIIDQKPPSSSKEPPYHLLNHKDNEDFSLSNGPLFIDPKRNFQHD